VYRVIKNLLIALISVGWVVPLQGFVNEFFAWLYNSRQIDYKDSIDCGFNLELGFFFFQVTSIWLSIVLVFWAFVAANKLWPIKKEDEKRKISESLDLK